MASGITAAVAEWAAGLRVSDIPSSCVERVRLQVASVLGSTFAGARSSLGERVRSVASRWGSDDRASIIPFGPRAPVHAAAYANAACSVAFDYDDYLFAGHTGHSSVLGTLAVGEALSSSGADALGAIVAANEVAGRLGGALLLGPHNGQMWALIHAIGGAVAAGRLHGLGAAALGHAIGIALAAPPYPLAPAFFGPDSKALIASGPLVEGIRAAELAAAGVTGADDILGDRAGVLARLATRPLEFVFTGLGSAWVTDSLTFKVFPGCAYVDTPVEAFDIVCSQFRDKHGRELSPLDVKRIRVGATMFTAGMESMSEPYRSRSRLRAADVNFSVGLSLGVVVAFGAITTEALEPDALASRRDDILAVAGRVSVEHDVSLTMSTGGLGDVGIDMMRVLGQYRGRLGAAGEALADAAGVRASNEDEYSPTLDDADFTKFSMRFPARVTLETAAGEEYEAEVEAPVGAAGRDIAETTAAVRRKFESNALHLGPGAYEDVAAFDSAANVRDVVGAVMQR